MLKRTKWRNILAIVIVLATITAFAVYFVQHPEVWRQLRDIPKGTLAKLLCLYVIFVAALALVNRASLKLCRATIARSENLLLTMYSSVINFFGPLQSGPAFRALYLKQKHGVSVKSYALASTVYYFFYGLISVLLLFSGVLKWWLVPIVIGLGAGGLLLSKKKDSPLTKFKVLALNDWPLMAAASLLQISVLVVIFWVELRAVSPAVEFSQVLIYTGAANLALFVSITPGAIGFREFFLVFSQRLHHIDTATIVAANTIDRAVYVLLMLILAVVILTTHASRRFAVKRPDAQVSET